MAAAGGVAEMTGVGMEAAAATAEGATVAAAEAAALGPLPEIPLEPPPAALDAAAQLEADLETAGIDPVRSIEDLAKETSPSNLPKVENATPLPEKKPTTPEERMNAHIEKNMQKWEADNLMPNHDVEPDKFEQWQTDKVTHREQMKVNAQFHEDIRTWEETHVDPGADKDPEGHVQWEKDREAHKRELKAAQKKTEPTGEKKGEQTDKEAQDEAEKVLTNPENEAKLKALRELYQKRAALLGERNGINQAIAVGKQAGVDIAKAEGLLIENTDKLSKIDADIQRLEAELKITGTKAGSLVTTILKILGAVGGAGVLLAVSGARSA